MDAFASDVIPEAAAARLREMAPQSGQPWVRAPVQIGSASKVPTAALVTSVWPKMRS